MSTCRTHTADLIAVSRYQVPNTYKQVPALHGPEGRPILGCSEVRWQEIGPKSSQFRAREYAAPGNQANLRLRSEGRNPSESTYSLREVTMTESSPWQKSEPLTLVRPRPWIPEIDPDSDSPGEEVPTWPDCERRTIDYLFSIITRKETPWQHP